MIVLQSTKRGDSMNDLKMIENDLVPVYETSKGVYGTELHQVKMI